MADRTCTTCGEAKDVAEYYRTSSGGLRGSCKECVKAKNREYDRANRVTRRAKHAEWREKNRDYLRNKAREDYLANKERYRAHSRRWAKENPEYYRQYNRRWYEANRERVFARVKAYREARPEWAAMLNRKSAQDYAARKAAAYTIPYTLEQLEARLAFYGGMCWMCRLEPGVEIDHVKPLSKGGPHILANFRPACRPCNASKNAAWPLR